MDVGVKMGVSQNYGWIAAVEVQALDLVDTV